MTTQKDFKRLVRARMQKTGEAYTTARTRLLTRKQAPFHPKPATGASAAVPASPSPTPADYGRIAGISDKALKARTGCTWESWVKSLDHVEAHTWPHGEIATHIYEKYKLDGWWAQMVTVGYERIKGLRARGQGRDGAFEATKSKTFAVPLPRLYRAFHDTRTRARWLPGVAIKVRSTQKEKSLRISWTDGTPVNFYFTAKGAGKSQAQLEHQRLPDKAAADRLKAYWGERLGALGAMLAPTAPPRPRARARR